MMVTIFQHTDFLSDRQLARPKYKGSFFSVESAYDKLGWFFVMHCCDVERF